MHACAWIECVGRIVEVPVEKIFFKEVPVPVEKIVYKEVSHAVSCKVDVKVWNLVEALVCIQGMVSCITVRLA